MRKQGKEEKEKLQQFEKTELFEKTPIAKATISLAIPMILSSLTMVIYNLADTYFVAMLNDSIQTAAVTLAGPILLSFNAVSNLFGVGTASMMSRTLGKKDYESVKRISAFGFYSTLFLGILYSVLYAAFKNPIMGVLGVDPSTYAATDAYMLYTVTLGAVPSILHVVLLNIVRAEGASMHASLGIIVGCGLNIVLDPIFILPWGLNMGAAGAGLATFISNCVSCIYYFVLIFVKRKRSYVCVSPKYFTLRKDIVLGVCGVGVPASIQNLLNVTGMTILNNFAVGYGADAVSAYGIVQKINMVPMNIVFGGAQGIMPLISYNYAAGNHKRMKNAVKFTMKAMLGFTAAATLIMFIFSGQLTALFMDNEAIVAYGTRFLRGLSLGLPFMCVDFVSVSIFQAVGMGKEALFFAIMRKIVLEIPALLILNAVFPLYGLAYAQPVAEAILSLFAILFLKRLFIKSKAQSESTL